MTVGQSSNFFPHLMNKWDVFFFFLILHKIFLVLLPPFSVCSRCIDSPKRMKAFCHCIVRTRIELQKKAFKIIWKPIKCRLEIFVYELHSSELLRADDFKSFHKKIFLWKWNFNCNKFEVGFESHLDYSCGFYLPK